MSFAVTALTLTPAAWPGALDVSLVGGARAAGDWSLELVDIRAFGQGRHKAVDDTPAGGGAGMVLRPDIIAKAVDTVARAGRPLIYPTPRGAPASQARVRELAAGPGLILLCGRFEGLDQRVIEARDMEEMSIGDIVLTGGDLPAQMLVDACVRLLPGVLGNADSHRDESFEDGLLEHPLHTRPREFEGRLIPDVLLSGDHARIEAWKRERALADTKARRPDLWAAWAAKKKS
jgi:tRNA (guanine37-N1)-methyltransferase